MQAWIHKVANAGARLCLGCREEVQDAGVVVDGLVKAAVVALHHVIHQVLHSLVLSPQLHGSDRAGCQAFQLCTLAASAKGSSKVTVRFPS